MVTPLAGKGVPLTAKVRLPAPVASVPALGSAVATRIEHGYGACVGNALCEASGAKLSQGAGGGLSQWGCSSWAIAGSRTVKTGLSPTI